MNNNIALPDIRAFVAVVECASFTKAADNLNVSRAHLSRQISQLERQLDAQLLIRTTRSQRLTEAGKDFFVKCQGALKAIDQAVLEVKEENKQLKGPVSINCVGGPIGEEIVSSIIADFLVLHPDVTFNLDFSSQRVDLINDGFDLVIRMGKLDDSQIIGRKLIDLPISTLASPSYLETMAIPTTPQDLEALNCLSGSIKKWSFHQTGKPDNVKEINVGGNFVCKNGRALIVGALKGLGIIRVPTFYCHEEIATGKLVDAIKGWTTSSTPVYALYHGKKHQSKRLKAFVSFLVNEFAKRVSNR